MSSLTDPDDFAPVDPALAGDAADDPAWRDLVGIDDIGDTNSE